MTEQCAVCEEDCTPWEYIDRLGHVCQRCSGALRRNTDSAKKAYRLLSEALPLLERLDHMEKNLSGGSEPASSLIAQIKALLKDKQ